LKDILECFDQIIIAGSMRKAADPLLPQSCSKVKKVVGPHVASLQGHMCDGKLFFPLILIRLGGRSWRQGDQIGRTFAPNWSVFTFCSLLRITEIAQILG
jgi:hypothetical protein